MSQLAVKSVADSFVIPLTNVCEELSRRIEMTEDDLKKMRGVYPIYKAIAAALGNRLGPPLLCGSDVRLEVCPDQKDLSYNLAELVVDLHNTAAKLHANANRDTPLPHGKIVKRPVLVRILEAGSKAHHAFGLTARAEINDKHNALPILDPGDFVEPEVDGELRKTGSFLVTGLRRNDHKGDGLFITENELPVSLPADSCHWRWQSIRDALDHKTHLVGTIVRESKSHPWMPAEGARLQVQKDLDEFDIEPKKTAA